MQSTRSSNTGSTAGAVKAACTYDVVNVYASQLNRAGRPPVQAPEMGSTDRAEKHNDSTAKFHLEQHKPSFSFDSITK